MTLHSLSCKQTLKKKDMFSVTAIDLQAYFVISVRGFPSKNIKNILRRLCQTLEPVGHNFHISVQVTDGVAYLHFKN